MTTQEFLSENRNIVISFYNSNVKDEANISLKDFMIRLMNNFKHTVKINGIYSEKNLYSNLFDLQYSAVENSTIGVTYSKHYSESNHAKAVAYFGKEKVQLMSNAK